PTLSEEDWEKIFAARRAVPNRDPDDLYAIGEVDAPVVMTEFADYRCSYCGQFTLQVLPELLPLVEDGTLRIEFRDFPIFQEQSIDAAVAARAAAQQNRFLDYHVAIYEYQFVDGGTDLSEATFVRIAGELGVPDIERFTTDLSNQTLIDEVNASYQVSMELLGRASTPQFVINDEYVGGSPPAETFLEVIDQELAKVQ
ncbi:MAG TPA: thioredoxin domain-containing protein, partial [Actinomycetaceae bacterium]|nr:thioredoxin domain-containing protein [Actinomycetaceae bacterium]